MGIAEDVAKSLDAQMFRLMTGRDIYSTSAVADAAPERTVTPQTIYDAQAAMLKALTGKNWQVSPNAPKGSAYAVKSEFVDGGEVMVCHPSFAKDAIRKCRGLTAPLA